MLARSMTDLLPRTPSKTCSSILTRMTNVPRVRTVPAGRAERIVKVQKEAIRQQREKSQRMLFIALPPSVFSCSLPPSSPVICSPFSSVVSSSSSVTCSFEVVSVPWMTAAFQGAGEARLNELPPFVDATATLSVHCLATFATIPSSRVAWKHLPTTVLSPVPSTEPTRVFSTSTKSTCFALRSNSAAHGHAGPCLPHLRSVGAFLRCPDQDRACAV